MVRHLCIPPQAVALIDRLPARFTRARQTATGARSRKFYGTGLVAFFFGLAFVAAGFFVTTVALPATIGASTGV